MIRKPSGAEQESRLHAAVGSAIETGAEVRAVGRKVQRKSRMIGVYYLFGAMAFGLLFSSTPIWFKAILFGGGYWAFKAWRDWVARRDSPS